MVIWQDAMLLGKRLREKS